MVAIPKIRIKFSEKRIDHSFGEDLSRSTEQSKKRGRNEIEDVQPKKKQKLDRDLSSQCLALLRSLMEHEYGWVFNTPVDPVKLMIPDYFSVISNPMDLGTIKSKLLKDEYGNADEFAADVRLTFDNAIRYNPQGNWVYNLAKEIKEMFEVRWELLKKKKVSKPSGIGRVTEGYKRQPVEVDCSRQSTPGTSASVSVGLAKPAEENSQKGLLLSKPAKLQSKKETPTVTPKALAQTTACKCGRTVCMCLKPCSSSGNGTPSLPALPPLPPEKALRAAMLKAKYADTIIKAKHRKVLDQNDKGDLIRIQIEKEQMERAQREEKARIEAEMRAAKVAAQMRAQAELKEERDRQRLELSKMERVFDFEQNNYLRLEKEFIKVCGCFGLTRIRLLFEELGLFLIDDDCDDLEGDLEEGEIL